MCLSGFQNKLVTYFKILSFRDGAEGGRKSIILSEAFIEARIAGPDMDGYNTCIVGIFAIAAVVTHTGGKGSRGEANVESRAVAAL